MRPGAYSIPLLLSLNVRACVRVCARARVRACVSVCDFGDDRTLVGHTF